MKRGKRGCQEQEGGKKQIRKMKQAESWFSIRVGPLWRSNFHKKDKWVNSVFKVYLYQKFDLFILIFQSKYSVTAGNKA